MLSGHAKSSQAATRDQIASLIHLKDSEPFRQESETTNLAMVAVRLQFTEVHEETGSESHLSDYTLLENTRKPVFRGKE